jgi:SAM-dependent methyltransferase
MSMRWERKAAIQRLIAKLPESLSLPLYYAVQRRFGGLRRVDHRYALGQGRHIMDPLLHQHHSVKDKSFLEIGSGRTLNVPIALWLCGAREVITVDLTRYLRAEMVADLIAYIRTHPDEVSKDFAVYADAEFQARLKRLIDAPAELPTLMAMLNVRYLAPADAAALPLPDGSIDYHVSTTVFEHVTPEALVGTLREGRRLLRPTGLFVHSIGLSDHFAHSDPSISTVNFLQFTEAQWAHYAGNRFMYHNRLRLDDYLVLFREAGVEPVSVSSKVDPKALAVLQNGFPLDARFRDKAPEVNAVEGATVVARP